MSLLKIQDLCVDYVTPKGDVRAVNKVSFEINKGEVFGLAGESGCGKTTVAFSIPRLHQAPAVISGGRIEFAGENVLAYSQNQLRAFRWSKVSMVFQSAMNSLNPVTTIEKQFVDVLMAHKAVPNKEAARRRAAELLEIVNIHPSRLKDYPHQFSGGMRQRIVIAIALALNPELIIMDEPTTALDVVVQREILQQIYKLKEEFGFSILFITHDISLMVEFSDRIGIMYAGELVEVAPAKSILKDPYHPYTYGLGNSFPAIHGELRELKGIPGTPLNLMEVPQGCRFQDRCFKAHDVCRQEPVTLIAKSGRSVACHLYQGEHEGAQL